MEFRVHPVINTVIIYSFSYCSKLMRPFFTFRTQMKIIFSSFLSTVRFVLECKAVELLFTIFDVLYVAQCLYE